MGYQHSAALLLAIFAAVLALASAASVSRGDIMLYNYQGDKQAVQVSCRSCFCKPV